MSTIFGDIFEEWGSADAITNAIDAVTEAWSSKNFVSTIIKMPGWGTAAHNVIQTLASAGVPKERAYQTAKGLGLARRKTDWLTDYRIRYNEYSAYAQQRALEPDDVIGGQQVYANGMSIPEHNILTGHNYHTIVKVTYTDINGELQEQFITIGHMEPISKFEAEILGEEEAYSLASKGKDTIVVQPGGVIAVEYQATFHGRGASW